jgi:hypothetical protein
VSGPIIKNKLFFTRNYEGLREAKALTTLSTFAPLAYRSGNFAGANTIYDRQASQDSWVSREETPSSTNGPGAFSVPSQMTWYWKSRTLVLNPIN